MAGKAVIATGAAFVYAGSAAAAYFYARSHFVATKATTAAGASAAGGEEGGAHGHAAHHHAGGTCAFDHLAPHYDSAIGQEEFFMWYGMMRKWLLKECKGDVLEVSAGTGRNFEYYDLDQVASLTVADLSQPMLREAEDKYFDTLRLGYKHPGTRITFAVADAHCLCDDYGRAARVGAGQAAAPGGGGSRWWRWGAPAQPEAAPGQAEAEAAAQAVLKSGPSSLAGGPEAARQRQQQQLKEMPGCGNPLNLFRVLLNSPSPSSSASPSDAAAPSAAATDGGGGAASTAPPAAASGASAGTPAAPAPPKASPSGEEAGGEGRRRASAAAASTSSSTAAAPTFDYTARCRAGVTEAGAKLRRFAPASFDCVVDSFGLCSHEDPVQALREMARVVKPDGKILLLQHGRAHYNWLNRKLDAGAAEHHDKWGCWWNRDHLALLAEAGLKVDKVSRWHFGTSYYIVCRPGTSL